MKIEYPAIFDPAAEGGYTITFPDFPEAISEGDTLEEANFNAIEVLDLTLKSRMEDNEAIPLPHIGSGEHVHMIAPDVNIQAALLIKLNRGEKKFSDLARSLGTSWPAVSRMEDPKHWPSLRQLDKMAVALGKRLVLSLE